LEEGDRLIGPLEHSQGLGSGLLPTEELFDLRDVLARYRSEPHVIANRIVPHSNQSNTKLPMDQRLRRTRGAPCGELAFIRLFGWTFESSR
jgi:hypothetical protein